MNEEQLTRTHAMWEVAYLKVLGVTPPDFTHSSLREYLTDVQRRKAALLASMEPDAIALLRKKTRWVVWKMGGLRAVAKGYVPSPVKTSPPPVIVKPASPVEPPQPNTLSAPILTEFAKPPQIPSSRERHDCRRKIRHHDYLSAMIHASLIDDNSGALQIYPCRVCDGLHVGHNPTHTKLRKVAERLTGVEQRLAALELERVRLEDWRNALLRRREELLLLREEQAEDFADNAEAALAPCSSSSGLFHRRPVSVSA